MWRNELFFSDVTIEDGALPELYVEIKADMPAGEEAPPSRTLQVIGVLEENEALAASGIQINDGLCSSTCWATRLRR